ncbi:GNAT family N-acetyltransferase [Kineococcus glutinatus]|uniref:GNAT family N-acetyltransferase n=1 Tax=Kineococcus glutinatus TaxID=1070872 RepID=A0ABP9HBA0_9ACTN
MTQPRPPAPAPAGPAPGVRVTDVDVEDVDELTRWALVPATGFMEPRPSAEDVAKRQRRVRGHRLLGGVVGGRLVGSLRSFDTELTLPGARVVPANAVSSVAVLPTHRRRGVLTSMMRTDLARARERGQALAVLIASEAPIYGRYGFGAATEEATWTLDTTSSRLREDAPADAGTVELVEAAAVRAQLQAVHDGARRARAGGLRREERWWDLVLDPGAVSGAWDARTRTVLRRGPDGTPDGYCTYTTTESSRGRVSTAQLRVDDLTATTPQALRALWELVASVDLVRTVRAAHRPVDEVLPWLLRDPRAAQRTGQDDFLWVRVLDTAAALGARGYDAPGRLVLRVHDEGGPAAGTVLLDAGADGVEVTRTDAEPDVELAADALGSLLLGGVDAALLARAGRLRARDGAAVPSAAALFRGAEVPWCATEF